MGYVLPSFGLFPVHTATSLSVVMPALLPCSLTICSRKQPQNPVKLIYRTHLNQGKEIKMKQIRKPYSHPTLTFVGIQVENQLLAGSGELPGSYTETVSTTEGSGTDALGKGHRAFDLWDDEE